MPNSLEEIDAQRKVYMENLQKRIKGFNEELVILMQKYKLCIKSVINLIDDNKKSEEKVEKSKLQASE